jgi:hypothetical protein
MTSNPYDLDDVEMARHDEALASQGSFGPEASVTLPNGFSMRTAAYPADAVYVRVCAPDGVEIAYFDEAEFARDAENVLGALVAHLDREAPEHAVEVAVTRDPGENPHRLMPGEMLHRDATSGNGYGEETTLVNVANGFALATPDDGAVDYVRVCDPDGGETAYWIADEFAESPAEVIGAMFGAMVRGR